MGGSFVIGFIYLLEILSAFYRCYVIVYEFSVVGLGRVDVFTLPISILVFVFTVTDRNICTTNG